MPWFLVVGIYLTAGLLSAIWICKRSYKAYPIIIAFWWIALPIAIMERLGNHKEARAKKKSIR